MGSHQWKIHCVPSSKSNPEFREDRGLPGLTLMTYSEYGIFSPQTGYPLPWSPAPCWKCGAPSPKPPSRSPQRWISSSLRDPTDIYSTLVQNRKRPFWGHRSEPYFCIDCKTPTSPFLPLLGKQITPPILGANIWTQLTLHFQSSKIIKTEKIPSFYTTGPFNG